jgi:NADH-quinone oxidoreductase subunit A
LLEEERVEYRSIDVVGKTRMVFYLLQYLDVFIFLAICLLILSMILLALRVIAMPQAYEEKISVYECGFDAFQTTRLSFDISFIPIAILYLIFDLEIVILIPWVLYADEFDTLGVVTVFLFVLIVLIGFIYECVKGALRWS